MQAGPAASVPAIENAQGEETPIRHPNMPKCRQLCSRTWQGSKPALMIASNQIATNAIRNDEFLGQDESSAESFESTTGSA